MRLCPRKDLVAAGSMDVLGLIRARVEWCEAEGVTILCCPEAILAPPLASDTVTTIVGTAAVFHRGAVVGLYRKLYPAINRSVYEAGREVPVFQFGELTLGIVICNDSNYFEPARLMAARISDFPRNCPQGLAI